AWSVCPRPSGKPGGAEPLPRGPGRKGGRVERRGGRIPGAGGPGAEPSPGRADGDGMKPPESPRASGPVLKNNTYPATANTVTATSHLRRLTSNPSLRLLRQHRLELTVLDPPLKTNSIMRSATWAW